MQTKPLERPLGEGLARQPWGELTGLALRKLRAGGAVRPAHALAALLLFVFSLEVLRAGAGGVTPVLEGVSAAGAVNILGFGWLLVYAAMSGSPVAAIGLSLFAGGAVSDIEAFAMLNGSRLGASFFVLLVGFLYYLGHRRTSDGIFVGVVALITTFAIYAPVVPIGALMLDQGWLDGVEASAPAFVTSVKGATFQPLVQAGSQRLPQLVVFALGGALLLASFAVFDRALPDLKFASGGRMERIRDRLHHPLAMFVMGLVTTAVTMSVAISITLLIPLSLKGYIRRDSIIPYVMGANVSTWVDTMIAALLLDAPRAFTIVFTQVAIVSAISLVVLVLAYRPFSRSVLAVSSRVVRGRREFALFVGCLFLVPLALLLV